MMAHRPHQHERHRAAIARVTDHRRPLWSVMIPTYECAEYLHVALESVLSQDTGPHRMQIEVVDDHSTSDDPCAVVRGVGGGRVTFHRQSKNLGHVANFNDCLRRAKGELVHILHGDDYLMPGFYDAVSRAFRQVEDLGAAFTRHLYVAKGSDEKGEMLHAGTTSLLEREDAGILEDWLPAIAGGQRLAPPAIVVRRAVYERLGGFDNRLRFAGEDWEMWVRVATRFPVWFEPEVLAAYRVKRPDALTDGASRTGRLARDMRLATEIIEAYLPDYLPRGRALDLTRRARSTYAQWGLEAVEQMVESGHWLKAIAQTLESIRCSPSRRTAGGAARILTRKLCSSIHVRPPYV